MHRIAILVATVVGVAVLPLAASAVPIVFTPPQITLATDPFNVTGSMTVDLVDLDDPDPNLARFELVIEGEFQNYRGGYSESYESAGFFQREEFHHLPYLQLLLRLPGILSATVEQALGVETVSADWTGPVDETLFQFDFARDPQPVPGQPNDVFDLPTQWSARLAYLVQRTGAGAAGELLAVSAGQVDFAELLDGVSIGYSDGSGDAAEDSALFAVSAVPEPASGLLLAAGLAVAWRARQRGRSATRSS
jgi:hypothetical protein